MVWTAGSTAPPGVPLVAAGDAALMTEQIEADGRRLWTLDLEPRSSSLHRSPDWPILLTNLVEVRRRELPGPVHTQLVLGEPFMLRARTAGRYTLRGPGVERDLESPGDVVVGDLRQPGTYELKRAEGPSWAFAVNFVDPRESDLRNAQEEEQIAERELGKIAAALEPWQILLLSLALAAVFLDWAVLAGWLQRLRTRSPGGEGARP